MTSPAPGRLPPRPAPRRGPPSCPHVPPGPSGGAAQAAPLHVDQPGLAFLPCWYFVDNIFAFLQQPILKLLPAGKRLAYTGLTDPFLLYFKVAALAAVFLASPFILFQFWRFVAPGLYKHERRYLLPFLFFGSFFFLAGGAFAYYVAFPLAAEFLLGIGAGLRAGHHDRALLRLPDDHHPRARADVRAADRDLRPGRHRAGHAALPAAQLPLGGVDHLRGRRRSSRRPRTSSTSASSRCPTIVLYLLGIGAAALVPRKQPAKFD